MQKTRKILFLLGFLLALFTGFRLLFAALYFYAGNYETAIWLKAFYWGLRIDFTLLFVANLPLFLFIFFLDNIFKPEVYKRISWLLACIVNIPLVLIELLDIGYFRYIQRRSNMDLFTVAGDAIPAYKQFIADFWWLLLIAGGAVFIMIRVFKKITCALPVEATSWKQKLTWVGFLIMGLVLARGLQSRPIIPATPFLYLPAGLQPLSVNSSYSLVYSLIKGEGRLAIKDYFSGEELDQLYKIRKKIPVKGSRAEADSSGGNSVRKNIVIFILESFAKEYLDPADPLKAETPFLDSIA
ncbi:MAG TPA: hypothetical protein VIK74_07770, partial [Parasegetibacter sp.]